MKPAGKSKAKAKSAGKAKKASFRRGARAKDKVAEGAEPSAGDGAEAGFKPEHAQQKNWLPMLPNKNSTG